MDARIMALEVYDIYDKLQKIAMKVFLLHDQYALTKQELMRIQEEHNGDIPTIESGDQYQAFFDNNRKTANDIELLRSSITHYNKNSCEYAKDFIKIDSHEMTLAIGSGSSQEDKAFVTLYYYIGRTDLSIWKTVRYFKEDKMWKELYTYGFPYKRIRDDISIDITDLPDQGVWFEVSK